MDSDTIENSLDGKFDLVNGPKNRRITLILDSEFDHYQLESTCNEHRPDDDAITPNRHSFPATFFPHPLFKEFVVVRR